VVGTLSVPLLEARRIAVPPNSLVILSVPLLDARRAAARQENDRGLRLHQFLGVIYQTFLELSAVKAVTFVEVLRHAGFCEDLVVTPVVLELQLGTLTEGVHPASGLF
jgi:hypothetical protein